MFEVKKLALVKLFAMLKNVDQNTILLAINQNQPNNQYFSWRIYPNKNINEIMQF